jgi:tRNA(Arg) A34 adenosine deaminase TadA
MKEPTAWDCTLMDRVLQEAHDALVHGGAGVATLLASPDRIIALARNTIQTTGHMIDHAEMVIGWESSSGQ